MSWHTDPVVSRVLGRVLRVLVTAILAALLDAGLLDGVLLDGLVQAGSSFKSLVAAERPPPLPLH